MESRDTWVISMCCAALTGKRILRNGNVTGCNLSLQRVEVTSPELLYRNLSG